MKIKVRLLEGGKMPQVNEKGDLFDLFAAETVDIAGPYANQLHTKSNTKVRDVVFESAMVRLGVAMEIPKGFKANLYPRSSTFKNWFVTLANSVGQIDSSYCGNKDEWKAFLTAFANTKIEKGDKIMQFEIVPSSKATIWQKIKWLFSNKIEFVEVDCLTHGNRGGFGSTGKK